MSTTSTENGQKKATVEVRRLQEAPPGDGAPAGWLPQIIYQLQATDIPFKPEGFTIQIGPKESFLFRRLIVNDAVAGSWSISVKVDNLVVFKKSSARILGELIQVTQWPPADRPRLIKLGQRLIITLFPEATLTPSDRFACALVGAEAK